MLVKAWMGAGSDAEGFLDSSGKSVGESHMLSSRSEKSMLGTWVYIARIRICTREIACCALLGLFL